MSDDMQREAFEKWWREKNPDSDWGKELAWDLWCSKQESHDD